MTKILIFEIEGELGLFKKYYTTASLLTFDFPPKTSLIGLIGALLGFERKTEGLFNLQELKIGIEIINPIRKLHQGVNWLNTKVRGSKAISSSTKNQLSEIMQKSSNDAYGFVGDMQYKPTNIQLLIEPKFRVFVEDNNTKYFEGLENALINQKYVFSPYLGQSEHLATIKYIDLVDSKTINNENPSKLEKYECVVPVKYILEDNNGNKAIDFESNNKLIIETMPLKYEKENVSFGRIVYNKERKPILLASKIYHKIIIPEIDDEFRNVVLY